MAGRMLLHLASEGELSACGVRIPPSNLTDIEDHVSCRSCQRHFNPTVRNITSKGRPAGTPRRPVSGDRCDHLRVMRLSDSGSSGLAVFAEGGHSPSNR